MKTQTVALWTAATVAALGVGYVAYFDYQRRSDPEFRKKLKKARKHAAKEAKKQEEVGQADTVKLIESVIVATAQEEFPTSPEEREKYFMAQVSAGETLCSQGEAYYNDAVLPFFKALKVYPAPMELLMIYQKTIPEPVLQIILNIVSIEQQAAEAAGATPGGQASEAASAAEPEEIPIE
ncbi:mitochondrial outer membrane translocase complex, subunit Tom20 domain-containing protein [Zychaea mexicana]|uniref:mitochondrial outer membrane translocase complex, subunit Tom20 domain-containing protein n=1 Tax=Zychaea mexicana TaxID=64656 RepID=UPI0022FE3AE7|nr:mitochondrial outer membrane translocase complex, subunit Tom20 domain-containing protein [Zychaea mexicana]KAI9479605.1 mitochondrial outer membrane translocase complex, subunit Tom20 domain-containing protein [Zychaea mexicana]